MSVARREAPCAAAAVTALLAAGCASLQIAVPSLPQRSPAAAGPAASWEALNQRVTMLYQQGRYAEATPLAVQALERAERAFDPFDARLPAAARQQAGIASALTNLAELYRVQGRVAEAEPLLKRTLDIYGRAPEVHPTELATALNNLGDVYRLQRRYAEAEPLLQRALALWEQTGGATQPKVAIALNNLAELYRAQSKFAEAAPLYERALAILETVHGHDHPEVATALNNWAGLYRDQHQPLDAAPLLTRALAIDERVLGPAHPHTMTVRRNLIAVYKEMGDAEAAQALEARERR